MRLEGQAHLGVSTHFWTFYDEDETLKLHAFSPTFAGTQQPLPAGGNGGARGALVFHTPQPHFLEGIRPQAQTLTLRIFLRGTPHVEIALTRRE